MGARIERPRLPEIDQALFRGFEEHEGGLVVGLGHDTAAIFEQRSFRWRNDDGTETTATWAAAENANPAQGALALDTNYRIRFEMEETATASPAGGLTPRIQYNKNSAGWINVTTSSLVVRAVTSANVSDGTATTNQISTSTRSFLAGTVSADGSAGSVVMSNQQSEFEYIFQLRSADLVEGDVVQIRVTNVSAPPDVSVYTNTPSYTVGAAATPGLPPQSRIVLQAVNRASTY